MAKLDWVPVVDRFLDVADRALDRVRKTPRRRLDAVPPSKVNPDPFAPAPPPVPTPAKVEAPVEKPLGESAIAAQIYGRRTCMWSGRSQRLLIDLGSEPSFYDLDDPEHRHLETRLVRETKQPELPWIYVRGEFIGGYRALDELARLGKLEELLLPPEQRAAEKKRRVRIEAPPKPGEHHAPPSPEPSAPGED